MTHSDLVVIAARWLKRKHPVVVTELVAGRGTSDAIGWSASMCTMVEVKVSRSDFFADAKKLTRQAGTVGNRRYYMAPKGLLKPEEIPDGWGLLEVFDDKSVTTTLRAPVNPQRRWPDELTILVSALRRVGAVCPKGISVKAYVHQTKCRATLSVDPDEDDSAAAG